MLERRSFLTAASLLMSGAANAQARFPANFIKMVVPFPAGGPSDIVARLTAKGMTEKLGQPVVIDNKAGAGGNIGTDFVAHAAPDGYTLLAATIAITIAPGLYKSPGFDPVKDFAPIGLISGAPLVIAARSTLGVTDVAGLVALMKASPGKYSYGSSGYGSVDHLGGALFESRAGVKGLHVPFRGAAPSIQALVSGTIDFAVTTEFVLMPHIVSGSLKALAVAANTRSAGLPAVPTAAETGLTDFEIAAWYCLLAPSAVPPDIRAILNDALRAALANPEVRDALSKQGIAIAKDQSPEYLARYIGSETARWTKVLAAAGVEKQ